MKKLIRVFLIISAVVFVVGANTRTVSATQSFRPKPEPRPHTVLRLKVSDNRRFLVTADGKPFFYLGDTAWELFHRLNREEADRISEEPRRRKASP